MATASVKIGGRDVPVQGLSKDFGVEHMLRFKPFEQWCQRLDPDLEVKSLLVQSVDMFGPRVGFLKFRADAVRRSSGHRVPGVVFMRGVSVAVLIVLKSGGREWTVLTRQARLPIGRSNYVEIPAGMMDDESQFSGVAAKELQEETGLVLRASDLVDLTALAYGGDDSLVYPSAGGCDEGLRLFLARREVSAEELASFQDRLTGVGPHEEISLTILPLEDLWKSTTDMKALCALQLFEQLRRTGALP